MTTLSLKNRGPRVNGTSVSALADIADLYTAVSLDDVDQDAEEQANTPTPEEARYDNATEEEFGALQGPDGKPISEAEYRRQTEAEAARKALASNPSVAEQLQAQVAALQAELAGKEAKVREQVHAEQLAEWDAENEHKKKKHYFIDLARHYHPMGFSKEDQDFLFEHKMGPESIEEAINNGHVTYRHPSSKTSEEDLKEAIANEQPGQDEKSVTQAAVNEQVRKENAKVTKPKRVEFRPIGSAPDKKEMACLKPEQVARISDEAGRLRKLFVDKTINGVAAGEKLAQAFVKIYPFLDSLNPGGEGAYWAFRNWAKSAQKDFIWGFRGMMRGQEDRQWARRGNDSEKLIAAQDRIEEGKGQLVYGMVKLYAIDKMWRTVAHEQAERIWDHNWYGLLLWMEVDYVKRRQEEGDRRADDVRADVENVLDTISTDLDISL